ncbi:rod shape-determining protein MreC [Riemerella columbipharyngis]|uniref:Cell shape-determining protein MreC n=1 Tax=Riemerella columbipharyngis TaxID=1071918 RepID=A0A1G7AEG8_9FLAO|nr:rod shape-determining protein MreC [Riemerella columbipharyngis]SDE12415.1 rod shape-determining protein MreC [Riemerella columbipharyngis]
MGSLVRFFSKNSLFLFFIFLQAISVVLLFTRNSVQRSFLAGEVAAFNAWVSGYIDEGTSYLKLKEINKELVAQNKHLMEQTYGKNYITPPKEKTISDTLNQGQVYTIIDADVLNNTIIRKDNYFTLNKGQNQGVQEKMGVISPKGIAGIVINSMPNYALVQSVLSANKMRINAALKKNGYFGTLTWKGDDSRVMHLSDIPKYIQVKVGDTVITDGKSDIFPEGVMVGTVAGYDIDPSTGFWDISVELSQKMGNIQKVYIVKNLKKKELNQMQDSLKSVIENDK